VSFARNTAAHVLRNWGLYLAAALIGVILCFGSGCISRIFPSHMGQLFHPSSEISKTPPAPCVAPDMIWLHGLGLACFGLAIASFIARIWVPLIPMRLALGLAAGGLGCYVLAWILAKLIWLVAIAALLVGGEFAWRWWKSRQKPSVTP
jgi:hypothetical protein